jgi:hypothetical protein
VLVLCSQLGSAMPKVPASYPVPLRQDHEEFLVRCYFGPEGSYLSRCIKRAYLDLNRTLHGMASVANSDRIRADGHALVETVLDGQRWSRKLGLALERRTCSDGRSNRPTKER